MINQYFCVQYQSVSLPQSKSERNLAALENSISDQVSQLIMAEGEFVSICEQREIKNIEVSTIAGEVCKLRHSSCHEMSTPSTIISRLPERHQERQQFRDCTATADSSRTPKLSFTSRRVKEYFESLKSHDGETVRLYQFFKSIRTEMVACLLFALITSQALIVCRTHLTSGPHTGGQLIDRQPISTDISEPSQVPTLLSSSLNPHTGDRVASSMGVHLANGLVSSFAVASLTQIFGHISGCHLLPSISLALYIKGHISRLRLASYLAAQSMGSLLGVSLLGLLTSSQITLYEYHEVLARRTENLVGHRQRRDTNESRSGDGSSGSDNIGEGINLNDFLGSETILLSIMEQQQQQLQQRQRNPMQSDKPSPEEATITVRNASTYETQQQQRTPPEVPKLILGPPLVTRQSSSPAPPSSNAASQALSQTTNDSRTSEVSSAASETTNGESRVLRQLILLETPAKRIDERVQPAASLAHQRPALAIPSSTLPLSLETLPSLERRESLPTDPISSDSILPSSKQPSNETRQRLRRKKRNRIQDRATNSMVFNPANRSNNNENSINNKLASNESSQISGNSKYYVNLLEFALPDAIMSSETIRQCIVGQQANSLRHSNAEVAAASPGEATQESISRLLSNSFAQCLSLSNSSQMFVFQLLATLLIVLTYLVNVDPRRIDLGFKSLSIGLAYFVASTLTVHSGGFHGNPFHLLALNWLSTTGEWHNEWLIYLVTPFIGGLFGAISHEYIDFTSVRNRNKRLHMRRSFYSLDDLQLPTSPAANGTAEPLDSIARGQMRKLSSSSLDSAGASSQLTGAGQQDERQVSSVGSTNRKLASYAHQLRLEQRRLAQVSQQQQSMVKQVQADRTIASTGCCIRRSDFDSNFLISSSPTANSRQINSANGFA